MLSYLGMPERGAVEVRAHHATDRAHPDRLRLLSLPPGHHQRKKATVANVSRSRDRSYTHGCKGDDLPSACQ